MSRNAGLYSSKLAEATASASAEIDRDVHGFFTAGRHPAPGNLFQWALGILGQPSSAIPAEVREAAKIRRAKVAAAKTSAADGRRRATLFRTPQRLDAFNHTVFHTTRKRLPSEYPIRGFFVAESAEIFELWQKHFSRAHVPDSRNPFKPITLLDKSPLFPIHAGLPACVVRDQDTGELVVSVVRNFSRSTAISGFIAEVALEGVSQRRSIRVSPHPLGMMVIG